jgi:hypothetical protein
MNKDRAQRQREAETKRQLDQNRADRHAEISSYEQGQAGLLRKPASQITLLDIDQMSSSTYKARLTDGAFSARVDELEKQRKTVQPVQPRTPEGSVQRVYS